VLVEVRCLDFPRTLSGQTVVTISQLQENLMHDVLALALVLATTIVSVLIGTLFNNRSISTFRDDVNSRFDRMDGRIDRVESKIDRMQSEINPRIDRVQADLTHFYRHLGRRDARLDNIEKRAGGIS
jgi:chaperonin cofactor prefoldin